ncbi:LAFA_0E13168g1_1 [Lachancea sp. 'fantastica']|nr:LAFA_0E13168g1_1 [Lachancea sp. 'fantastica']
MPFVKQKRVKTASKQHRPSKRHHRHPHKSSQRLNATRETNFTQIRDSNPERPLQAPINASVDSPAHDEAPLMSSPSFLDNFLHWEETDDITVPAPLIREPNNDANSNSLLLVHTQPVHSISTALLHDTLDELESRSLSPSFSAFSDRLLDSLPEPTVADSFDASKVPRNPPVSLRKLAEVTMQMQPARKPLQTINEARPMSPETSFVQYLSHKLSRYCGYVPSDSQHCDKIRLQEISYRLSKTAFDR